MMWARTELFVVVAGQLVHTIVPVAGSAIFPLNIAFSQDFKIAIQETSRSFRATLLGGYKRLYELFEVWPR